MPRLKKKTLFAGFDALAFRLMRELAEDPTQKTYARLKTKLHSQVELPLLKLFEALASQFEDRYSETLETKRNIIARFLKNDYGKGQAYKYLWAAFYEKGKKRKQSAQLFIKIQADSVLFGFALGKDSAEVRAHLLHELKTASQRKLREIFKHSDWKVSSSFDPDHLYPVKSLDEFIAALERGDASSLKKKLSKEEVIGLGPRFIDIVKPTFDALMPLFLVACESLDGVWNDSEDSEVIPGLKHQSSLIRFLEQMSVVPESETGQLLKLVYQRSSEKDTQDPRLKQLIFVGPPGTGKTYLAKNFATLVARSAERVEIVQFHPGYSYEDFIIGLRPNSTSGKTEFITQDGLFLRVCQKARLDEGNNYVILIDEINRGNLSRILGELMFALEYRNEAVQLSVQENGFPIQLRIPHNVYLIATMNSADRSIALLDYALRRRFLFIRMNPNPQVLENLLKDSDQNYSRLVISLFTYLNEKLEKINPELVVGHSYFKPWPGEIFSRDTLNRIWTFSILPLIEEYLHGDPSEVAQFQLECLLQELDHSREQTGNATG